MEITIKIEAPELTVAINNLATALELTIGSKAEKIGKTIAPISDNTATIKKPEAEKSFEEPKKTEAETIVKEEAKPAEEAKTYTLVQVREKLAELSRAGKQKQVKALIEKCGASKLSEIDEAKYPELMQEAGKL